MKINKIKGKLILMVLLTAFLVGLSACKNSNTNQNTNNSNVSVNKNAVVSPGLILGISPNTGSASGGTSVKVTGKNFQKDAKLYFGAKIAKDVVIKSETEIDAKIPAGDVGLVDVILRNTSGLSSTLQEGFSYE